MKKLLVPTDFSPYADTALKFAISIAQKHQSEILLLHVQITPVIWSKLTTDQENLYPETKALMNKAKEELSLRLKQIKANGLEGRSQIQFSDGKEQVSQYISREKFDMVIMGSHGNYGFKEHMLGSNTYNVLRNSNIPVLVVKRDRNPEVLKKVVFATDFKNPSGKAFRVMIDMIQSLGLTAEVLYVNTPSDFLEDDQIIDLGKGFLNEFGPYPNEVNIYSAYRVERGIMQFAKKVEADAVALITHGRNDLQQLFLPSVAENLISYLDLPVFSLNVNAMQ
jgi:nucleotide-binding universal stress UspA family protein